MIKGFSTPILRLFAVVGCFCLAACEAILAQGAGPASLTAATDRATATNSPGVPLHQLGALVEKQYSGDGISVRATADGARLRCVFQKMEGEVTREGLRLTSTAGESKGEGFRVRAVAVGRAAPDDTATRREVLAATGTVEVAGKVARFIRPGLIEEYSVSADGVRQDFVVGKKREGTGELRVTLAVDGARAEPAANGVCLVLEHSGRKIAYSRLHVTDATGRELPARMELANPGETTADPATEQGHRSHSAMLVVEVNDATAVYPVRIDPTFSDENWISLGGFPGVDVYGTVTAVALDGLGNLYIGGQFGAVGNTLATNVAKWNGSSWTALGAGLGDLLKYGDYVAALAVSGSDLYAGGWFTNAGGIAVNNIAKWNGSSWTALGSGLTTGINGALVDALAVSGSDLYAGGGFTRAGGNPANNIAKWNGTSWTALGSGLFGSIVYTMPIGLSHLRLLSGGE